MKFNGVFFATIVACGGTDTGIGTGPDTGSGQVNLTLQQVATGLASPVYLTSPPNDNRLFVVEQAGQIRIISGGEVLQQPFLDIHLRVRSGGEQGLLSVAFHPQYAGNGRLYVNYTNLQGHTIVERYTASGNPNVADPNSGTLVLSVNQPFGNHNGGHLLFGPDGMLYIPLGDGGSGGDPGNRAQNPDSLLGKVLRINVNAGNPYSIPPDNPFAAGSGGRPEIWALGLRNPWRTSFDRAANRFFIADVGQSAWEEINAVDSRTPGLNYGWNIMEGNVCFSSEGTSCNTAGLTRPVHVYGRGSGICSVTGGYVYRGNSIPEIRGHYFFSDYCAGGLRSFTMSGGTAQNVREWPVPSTGNVSSFGEDANGELYIVSHGGTIWRIVAAP